MTTQIFTRRIDNIKFPYALRGIVALLIASALMLTSGQAAAQRYLQCVPFARELSGVQIYGDAHTWWKQAAGKYARGAAPKIGSVMSFKSTAAMPLGHIAVVSKIKNKRELLISHANWSPINGRRGQIERNVLVIDVSDRNDWSMVRVWYAPTQSLGVRTNPLNGFIYPATISPQAANEAKGVKDTGRKDKGKLAKDNNSKLDKKAAKKAEKQRQKDAKVAAKADKKAAEQAAEDAKRDAKKDKGKAPKLIGKPAAPKPKSQPKATGGNDWDRSAAPPKKEQKGKPAATKTAAAKPAVSKPARAKPATKSTTPKLDAIVAGLRLERT
jgi:surface antigen